VAGSRSPVMQNAAFAARGLPWTYVACRVDAPALEAAVRGLAALGFAGANVTRPHKQAVALLCDELDEAAARSGSVNTLVFDGDRILGGDTDGEAVTGVVGAAGKRVLVLGAGGAARAVAAALSHDGAADVRLASRRDPDWPPSADDADVLVNAADGAHRGGRRGRRRRPRDPCSPGRSGLRTLDGCSGPGGRHARGRADAVAFTP
jgi:shikimate 5-dehydrogenase